MIASIDPGLDRSVAALFRLPTARGVLSFAAGAAHYLELLEVSTAPETPLVARLCALALWAEDVAARCEVVFIEQPTIYGVYARHRNQKGDSMIPRGMAMLYMAMGALCAGAGGLITRVDLVSKPKVKKAVAHQLVKTAFAEAGKGVPARLRGADDADALDAIFLGLWAFSKWAAPNLSPRQTRLEALLAPATEAPPL